jgi:hypothetical protein
MCPACVETAAAVTAGALSTGGILAICLGKIRKCFMASGFALFHKTKEK